VAEEQQEGSSSGAGSHGGATSGDPAAVAIALSGADREEANTFLREQTKLARLQMEEMRQRNSLELSHLRLRRFSGWAKAAFECCAGLLALALVSSLSAMVWKAAHSDGLVIESFAVPSDLAARGLSGQAIASQTLDKLTAIISSTNGSVRAAKSYSSNQGDDIKVEIPETGVSVGEAYRFLKNWLGHETHISGEIWRTSTGIAITARVSGQEGVTLTGSEANLTDLVQKLAEHIAHQTQPYRFGVYLLRIQARATESLSVFKELATTGPAKERPWGYIGWANSYRDAGGSAHGAVTLLRKALALQPNNALALNNLAGTLSTLNQLEESQLIRERELAALAGGGDQSVDANVIPGYRINTQGLMHKTKGAFGEAAKELTEAISLRGPARGNYFSLLDAQTRQHDVKAARAILVDAIPNLSDRGPQVDEPEMRVAIDLETQDWPGLLLHAKALDAQLAQFPNLRDIYLAGDAPRIALAQAKLGDFKAAEASLKPTLAECYPCLTARASVAELQGQHARADWWFARAMAEGPSIPFANFEWGRALLERGKPDEAIAKFTASNRQGPHFADALEGWGEALMAKNQSHLALAKFEESEKYAPNWGRLHLKWGEALTYAGRKDDAVKQFARAAQLDLTPSEKAELARHP